MNSIYVAPTLAVLAAVIIVSVIGQILKRMDKRETERIRAIRKKYINRPTKALWEAEEIRERSKLLLSKIDTNTCSEDEVREFNENLSKYYSLTGNPLIIHDLRTI